MIRVQNEKEEKFVEAMCEFLDIKYQKFAPVNGNTSFELEGLDTFATEQTLKEVGESRWKHMY